MSVSATELPGITVEANAYPQPMIRRPRGLVQINGTTVPGWLMWEVTNNSFLEADTFRVVYSISALPVAFDEVWFAEQTETFIKIFGGFPQDPNNPQISELTSFIYGRIDDLEFDFAQRTMTLSGRDLTGVFIDTKVTADYLNQKSSQIAAALAAEHGLQTQITPTTVVVGPDYNNNSTIMPTGSEWDLLASLARFEGFAVYVSGQTLYFGPDTTGQGSTLRVNYSPPQGDQGSPILNTSSLAVSRSATVTKGITVTVQSAGVLNKSVKASYPIAPKSITPGKSSPYGATTNYYAYLPAGATAQQCMAQAEALYNEIASHAMKMRFEMPADESTSPISTVALSGTGTAFDQGYFVTAVTRHLSVEEGFRMEVQAQNASPNLSLAEEAADEESPPPTDEEGDGL